MLNEEDKEKLKTSLTSKSDMVYLKELVKNLVIYTENVYTELRKDIELRKINQVRLR